jgi:hypothetical protein
MDLREIDVAGPDGPSPVGTYDQQMMAGSPTQKQKSRMMSGIPEGWC